MNSNTAFKLGLDLGSLSHDITADDLIESLKDPEYLPHLPKLLREKDWSTVDPLYPALLEQTQRFITSARKGGGRPLNTPANDLPAAPDRFWYWVKERHHVHQTRELGTPKPWSEDEIFQTQFFCNVYRELDKTTVWFKDNIREEMRDDPEVLMATVIFRWFNYIPTGQLLLDSGLLTDWDSDKAIQLLEGQPQVFTSAYTIAPPEPNKPKLPGICKAIDALWNDRDAIYREMTEDPLLEYATSLLSAYPCIGDFMGYEVVTDLRHTHILEDATDIMTWANIGPGAARGLHRYIEQSPSASPPKNWRVLFQRILRESKKRLKSTGMPAFEMREVEHCLCEFDKFERARLGDSKMKRLYKGAK